MSIVSKTQGKKLEREISLTQRIEPGRMIRWSNVDISFGPKDHLDTELSDQNLHSWSSYRSSGTRWLRH
jgi:hypothetical protein